MANRRGPPGSGHASARCRAAPLLRRGSWSEVQASCAGYAQQLAKSDSHLCDNVSEPLLTIGFKEASEACDVLGRAMKTPL